MWAERVALRFVKITFGVIHSTAATTQEHLLWAPDVFGRSRALLTNSCIPYSEDRAD
jgi:hypothetical protein